ncbi:MAG: helix-turn-helix domain-containing protein [Chloroflexi bacterium]|nr:helix-turn-helix domain-containing protein [Chloroflexota bacterium]
MEKLLTTEQVCELFQIKRSTLYDWTHIGYIPHIKFPKGIRFKVSELEQWLKHRRRNGRNNYHISIPD